MITNDSGGIPSHYVEAWTKQIAGYVDTHNDNMLARNVLAQRKIGADVEIDQVTNFDRVTGSRTGAQIVAKGVAPDPMSSKGSNTPHTMLQFSDGFNMNRKDLKMDPQLKSRNLNIVMKNIHISEDDMAVNGSSTYNINGIVDAAQANANGSITAANNCGAWSGEVGTDIYEDVNQSFEYLGDFDPSDCKLICGKTVNKQLNRMDSERQTYADTIAPLFGKGKTDRSWLFVNKRVAAGYAYLVAKDELAGEFVVSENPTPLAYPMTPGQNFFVEVYSWSNVEIHDNTGFVEIVTT